MNYIYCYTNKLNGHQYVGQTNNIDRRIREHRSTAFNLKSEEYDYLFHQKLREYGENGFIFSILEKVESDDIKYVDEREIFWIAKLKTYVGDNNGGYNLTRGGHSSSHKRIYDEETIKLIKEKIKQGSPFSEIQQDFGISISHISAINHGMYYYDEKETYPLFHYYQSEENLNYIIYLLSETDIPMTEVAKITKKAYSTIKKINAGTLHHNNDVSYPIRKISSQKSKANIIKQMLLNKKSDKEIILATNVSLETIRRINQGQTHYDKQLNYPLR